MNKEKLAELTRKILEEKLICVCVWIRGKKDE